MKRYLGHWVDEQGVARVRFDQDPSAVLGEEGGRVSPLFLAAGQALHELPGDGAIVFMYPTSPRALLSALALAETRGTLGDASVFMTHGLASVVAVLSRTEDVPSWSHRWAEHLCAQDVWMVSDGRLTDETFALQAARDQPDPCPTLDLPGGDLPYEVEVEVDQFQTNLKLFWTRCRTFAPELTALGTSLLDAVETTVEAIAENLAVTGGEGRFAPTHYACVANLVEINSCLTMLSSQTFSCAGAVTWGFFSVGEYSLLGIGTVARSAWRLYEHTSRVFAQENHLERLSMLAKEDPFDTAHLNPYGFDYGSWINAGLDQYTAPDDELPRMHVVYFSSRWGFHQTMQSVSMSWQCIPSGATQEWNLLTFSHEFLHSHLRELLDALLLDPSVELLELVDLFNKEAAADWGEAATQFLISQLRWIKKGDVLHTASMPGPSEGTRAERVRQRMDEAELESLVNDQLRFLEEIATHVLDFMYFYDSQDGIYIASLWHSWSLVPNVQPQLDRYILRCLLALSSMWPNLDPSGAFHDACTRLANEFRNILDAQEHGLIREALSILEDSEQATLRKRLRTRFCASFLLVMFVRRYLVSENVHAKLFSDSQADDEGRYPVEPGTFLSGPIESPIGFLVNRFKGYDGARSRDQIESESLWQYLAIL